MSQRKYYDDSVPKVELVESDEEVEADRDLLSRSSKKTVEINSPRPRKEFVKVNLQSNKNNAERRYPTSYTGKDYYEETGTRRTMTKQTSQKNKKDDTSKLSSPSQNRNMQLANANFVAELLPQYLLPFMQVPDKYVVKLDGTPVSMYHGDIDQDNVEELHEQNTSEQEENVQLNIEVDRYINEQNKEQG